MAVCHRLTRTCERVARGARGNTTASRDVVIPQALQAGEPIAAGQEQKNGARTRAGVDGASGEHVVLVKACVAAIFAIVVQHAAASMTSVPPASGVPQVLRPAVGGISPPHLLLIARVAITLEKLHATPSALPNARAAHIRLQSHCRRPRTGCVWQREKERTKKQDAPELRKSCTTHVPKSYPRQTRRAPESSESCPEVVGKLLQEPRFVPRSANIAKTWPESAKVGRRWAKSGLHWP